jgi:hypothetical protein
MAIHIGVQIDRQTGSKHTCPLASVIFVTDKKPTLQYIVRLHFNRAADSSLFEVSPK